MSVKNLTTRGQIRTRKKYDKRRTNKNFSRKLNMNLQAGGADKPLDNNGIKIINYLRMMKLVALYLVNQNKLKNNES